MDLTHSWSNILSVKQNFPSRLEMSLLSYMNERLIIYSNSTSPKKGRQT